MSENESVNIAELKAGIDNRGAEIKARIDKLKNDLASGLYDLEDELEELTGELDAMSGPLAYNARSCNVK